MDTVPERPNVSPHITYDEYACKHCGTVPVDFYVYRQLYQTLFDYYEHLRNVWKAPLPVTSGYRCLNHNAEVGGASLSVHLWGLALDIAHPNDWEADQFYNMVERERPDLRIGRYVDKPTLVHIDVAYLIVPRGTKAWMRGVRWRT